MIKSVWFIGLFQKKPNRGSLGYTFLKKKKKPWNFKICHFTFRNSRENKLLSLEILQNFVAPLRNSKVKNEDPWKFHMSFSWTPLEIPLLFYFNPGISTCSFFNTPRNFMSLIPTVWIISGIIAHCCCNNNSNVVQSLDWSITMGVCVCAFCD